MNTTNNESKRSPWLAVVIVGTGIAIVAAAVLLYRHEQASNARFWRAVGIEKQIADEARGFLDRQADQAAAGVEATTAQAFAACLRASGPHASDMQQEVNLNRCEVEASQLAISRGFDQVDASAAISSQRQRLAEFIGQRRSQYEAK